MQKLRPLIEPRAFDGAARHLVKKAAAELGVMPTAISHQIRLLERYCGRTLFTPEAAPLVADGHRGTALPAHSRRAPQQ